MPIPLLPIIATSAAVGTVLRWRQHKNHTQRRSKLSAVLNPAVQNVVKHTNKPTYSRLSDAQIERNLKIATVTTGLAIAGAVGYPLLTLACIPGQIYLSFPFFKDGYRQLFKERVVKMAVLDATIFSLSLFFGFYIVNGLYLMLFNLSQKLINQTRQSSVDNLITVFGEMPRLAWIEVDGGEVQKSVEALEVGEVIVVNAGETIPADGTITTGVASIDQRMLTGEAQPAEKSVGDDVFAATTVLSGRILVCVKRAGADTVAAQIETILTNTASYQSQFELQGQQIADETAWPILSLGAITLPILGPSSAIAVLLSDIGYRMRFVGPLSVLNHLLLVSNHSILIKDGRALEALQTVDTFVFDKTGTLTQEQPHVAQVYICAAVTENRILQYAAAAEYRQTHPIAQAILQEAEKRDLTIPVTHESNYEIGYGLKVSIEKSDDETEDTLIFVGSDRFMMQESITIPDSIQTAQAACSAQGQSLIYVARNHQLIGAIALQATIRPEAASIINELHQRGMTTYVISGDQEQPTKQLADSLGIQHYFAEVLPEDKATLVERLQQQGRQICFVGDGINDSIALKKANVSVSLQGASFIATDTAQVILMDQTLGQLITLYDLAKDLEAKMKQNFLFSVVPGVICIGGVYLFHWGIVAAALIGYVSLGLGVGNAMLPALQHKLLTDQEGDSGDDSV